MASISSPRTQAMGAANAGGTSDQAKGLFDQGLSQMAYSVLLGKFPNVAPDVVTFKMLGSEPDEGSGVGAFVISRGGQTLYIPVVMAANQMKPLDILYFKDLNVFLPLTKEWLDEIGKTSLGELGRGTIPPQTLQSDVDIRNLVVPPTTGRYSYASAEEGAARVFDEARVHVDPEPQLIRFLERAPNRVKRAAARLLENQQLLKAAVWHFGHDALLGALALAQEKISSDGGRLSRSRGLFIADEKTKPAVFKEIWGSDSGVAFQGVAVRGFHAKDARTDHRRALRIQNQLQLVEPKESGAYRIWRRDGSPLLCFLVNGAEDFFRDGACLRSSYRSNESWKHPKTPRRYIGVTEDGKLLDLCDLVAEPVPLGELENSKVYKEIVSEKAAKGARVGEWGLFVRRVGAAGFAATVPVFVRTVTTIDSVKHVEVSSSDYEKSPTSLLIFDGEGRNLHGRHSRSWHLSRDYRFIPVTGTKYDARYSERDFLSEPRDVLEFTVNGLSKHGAAFHIVKRADLGRYAFGESPRETFSFARAIEKLALEAEVTVDDAVASLRTVAEKGRDVFWAIPEDGFVRLAAESEGKSKPGADPAQAAMDQVMAAQAMASQGPSPVDMAVAEQSQNIQGQIVALQQQLQLLQNIQQRANLIGGAGGAAGAPAAAAAAMAGPMDPSMMGAGQPVTALGGPPPPGPGGPPSPDASQEQPGATMTADDGSIDSILSQVNPQFLEQAAQLNDLGAFDASTLASMAQAPELKDIVGTYLPNLEKCLDNIGRVLLTLWMDETRIREDVGDQSYIELEDNLRSVFKGLGQLILRINQNTAVLRSSAPARKDS